MLLRVAVLALLLASSPALAAGRFSCDGADVLFHVTRTGPDAAAATLAIRRGSQTLSRDLAGDFVGGECLPDDRGRRMIVYQAYCGGSGCKDFANWGVIDPRTLRELLAPTDTNRDQALRLIGWALPSRINDMVSVATGQLIQIRPPKKRR